METDHKKNQPIQTTPGTDDKRQPKRQVQKANQAHSRKDAGTASGRRMSTAADRLLVPEVTTITPRQDDDDAEVCFICAEPIQFSAVSTCNHRTCHVCSLRIRALYKDYKCSYCKSESKEVLFTLPSNKDINEYTADHIACKDDKLGISFETMQIMEETMVLLRFNCPVPTCDVAANGWPDLKVHVRDAHEEFLCDLCVKNQKIFAHEHHLFTSNGLTKHYKFGDKDSQDNGFKGHPDCGFCHRAFYDDDELFAHCRQKHERCHVCDQIENGPGRAQYFQDYKQLDQHFRRDHFVCPEPSCLEQKFVVFGSEIDLKAHQIEAHPHGLSGQALRDARKVNVAFAGYEPPPQARGSRGRRPEINFATNTRQSGPMSREQLALHRHMEYQQSRAQMTGFGYALSEPASAAAVPAVQVPKPVGPQSSGPAPEAFPVLGGAKLSKSKQSASKAKLKQTSGPADSTAGLLSSHKSQSTPANLNKHQQIIDKVQMLTSYDDEKVALFKTNIAQFRSTNINAIELIDNLWSMFKVPVEALGSVITGSADLLDDDRKKQDLLTAWNDWKLKNRVDNPISSSSMASSFSNTGGGQRILNIKNRASRTANQTASVWSHSTSHQPASRDTVASVAQRLSHLSSSRNHNHYTPAWSAGGNSSGPGSGTATPLNGRSTNSDPVSDFPSLPESATKRVSTAHYFNNSSWGADTSSNLGVVGPEDYESEEQPEPTKAMKGKKKARKQILFTQGLQRG